MYDCKMAFSLDVVDSVSDDYTFWLIMLLQYLRSYAYGRDSSVYQIWWKYLQPIWRLTFSKFNMAAAAILDFHDK